MMPRTLFIIGMILIALATVPDLLVTPAVGSINLLFSILLSGVYVSAAWLLRDRAGWLGLVLTVPFGAGQFFTPVPYWMCADAGYRFCPSIAGTALKSAIFNAADALIVLLFITGYILVLLGMRAGARTGRAARQV